VFYPFENCIVRRRDVGCVLCIAVMSLAATEGFAQSCSQRYANSSEGVGVDTAGNVWVSGKLNGTLYCYRAGGVNVDEYDLPGYGAHGVAVTPVDDNVWVAVGGFKEWEDNRVLRFANNGTLLEDIPIIYPFIDGQAGLGTNALAVDADGNVWVTSSVEGASAVTRIDPVVNPPANCVDEYSPTNCSPVDMAVDLDSWENVPLVPARPVNYGDMTGMVTTRTRAKGTWTVVHDGGVYDAAWSKVTLNALDTGPCTEVGGTEDTEGSDERFEIGVRAADTEVTRRWSVTLNVPADS